MSTAQAAALTSCTACAAVGGAAAGGAFSSGEVANAETSSNSEQQNDSSIPTPTPKLTDEEHLQKLQSTFKRRLVESIPNSEGSDNPYKDKLGRKYSYFLASYKSVNTADMEDFWEASYAMYLDFLSDRKDELSPEFAETKVTSAFTEESNRLNTSLNNVCDSIYKKDETAITKATENDDKDKLRKNLWKFCSPLGKEPITIQDSQQSNTYDGKIGSNNKDSLISVLDSSNDFFWKLKGIEFLRKEDKVQAPTFSDAFFKPYLDSNKNKIADLSTANHASFKEQCKKAYEATAASGTSTADAPTQEIAKKYCSFVIE